MSTVPNPPRLIERAFCLKQASLDSVHEKNVRHGHISTLHIWPARRPLAACRAALIATLLPDPGNGEERERLLEKLGGRLVRTIKRKKLASGRIDEQEVEGTAGGILHWGREESPDLEGFRAEIRKAFGGRSPRVLDPFAGGGAIPLEAMRLGCEVTAIDSNPVAWFILKCTLEYPQRLAGQLRSLPDFAVRSAEFMETFFKVAGRASKRKLARELEALQQNLLAPPDVDLAWHVRAWGQWVLGRARADLERFYPIVDGKPTVAYLWARTVTCKGCRATIPLLKTRWLCRKDDKRVLLTMEPRTDRRGVDFGTESNVPSVGGNNSQRREHDRKIGAGTMSRSGAQCPCCPVIMTIEDIRFEGQAGRLGAVLTAVVVDTAKGREYRRPSNEEVALAGHAAEQIPAVFSGLPYGVPCERIPNNPRRFATPLYGLSTFASLFTARQLLALGVFAVHTRAARAELQSRGYPPDWTEAIVGYLALMFDRLANQNSSVARWNKGGENVEGTFARFALPLVWDFAEVNPLSGSSGGYPGALEWIAVALAHALAVGRYSPGVTVSLANAATSPLPHADVVITDPPYYDAIPYSDVSNFFYVWLRRVVGDACGSIMEKELVPYDDELVMDRFHASLTKPRTKESYEHGMTQAFGAIGDALGSSGRFVIVFAHKDPGAWGTLVGAIVRAGFIVDGSWPIQTERTSRSNALGTASLASSVWLVCCKRPVDAKPGWDNRVLEDMRKNIETRLREFWDAGIRGPDFVWAATGPALEAYSRHPVVKKANDPGQVMTVSEFLREVRRLVVEFAVGRMIPDDGEENAGGLDDVSVYYLLHRNDFGFEKAPAGACILYAQACGLSEGTLVDREILIAAGGRSEDAEEEDDDDHGTDIEEDFESGAPGEDEGTTSAFRLRRFTQRRARTLGHEVEGRVPPLVDQLHRLMQLWRVGEVNRVNQYLDDRALRRDPRFHQLVQAVLEMARRKGEADECTLLESISNHLAVRGVAPTPQPRLPHVEATRTDEDA